MQRRNFLKTATAVGATSFVAGCIGDSDDSEEGTVRIGAPMGLTGPYGAEAEDKQETLRLIQEDINEGDEYDWEIELFIEDTELDPARAVELSRQMIEEDDVDVFAGGPSSSSTGLAVAPLMFEFQVPWFSLQGTDLLHRDACNRYTFQMASSSTMSARGVAPLMDRDEFGDRWYSVTADYSWGHDLADELEQIANDTGREWLGETRSPFGASDMSDFLSAARDADPDVLFLIHYGTDNATAIEQAVSLGLHEEMKIVSPLALITATRAVSENALQHVYTGNNWYHGHDNERSQEYAENFNDRVGRYPSDLAQTAYKNVFVYMDALQRVGSKNAEDIINDLEGHSYEMLKGEEHIREEDHLNEQGYFLMQGKAPEEKEYDEDHMQILEFVERDTVTPEPTGTCDLDTAEDV